MRFINLGLEEEQPEEKPVDLNPDETSKALDVVQNQDSTETTNVIKVANYKEELEALRAKNKKTTDTPVEDEETTPTDGEEESSDTPTDESVNESEENESDKDEEDSDDSDDTLEKTDKEVAQEEYFVQGYKMALEGMDSINVMAKHHSLLKRRLNLGGISKNTAAVVINSLESYSERCGYSLEAISLPSIDEFNNFNTSLVSSKKLTLAIEGFLSTVWDSIVKFLKSIYNWIMDLLKGKKSTKNTEVTYPETKAARIKAIDDLKANMVFLRKRITELDDLRAKDSDKGKVNKPEQELLPEVITKKLFKTSDKGEAKEIYKNAIALFNVALTFKNIVQPMADNGKAFIVKVISKENGNLNDYAININKVSAVTLEPKESNDDILVKGVTSELFGGVQACFTYTGKPDTDFVSEGIAKSCSSLSKQKLEFISNKKEMNSINVFPIDKTVTDNLNIVITDIDKMYSEINSIDNHLTVLANTIETIIKGQTPDSWNDLDEKRISELRAQVTFIGAISGSMTMSYKNLERQINTYKDGISRLIKFHIK